MASKKKNPEVLEKDGEVHNGVRYKPLYWEKYRPVEQDYDAVAAAKAARRTSTNDPKGLRAGIEDGQKYDGAKHHDTTRKADKPVPQKGVNNKSK